MPESLPLRTRVHPLVRYLCWIYLVPRREWLKRTLGHTRIERIRNLEFVVPAGVFGPVTFRTGRYFSQFIADSDWCDPGRFGPRPAHALDSTTGTGAQALMLAQRGFQVTAVDVHPEAVRAARSNVWLNGLETRVEVLEGDLFGPVNGRKFDLVVCSPPLFRGDPRSGFDLAWKSPDFLERFAGGLAGVLSERGLALVLFTTDGDQEGFLGALENNALEASVVARKHFGNEIITIYRVTPAASRNRE